MIDHTKLLREFWADGVPSNFVGGQWRSTSQRTAVIDPSTGDEYSTAPASSAADVDAAVEAARIAQPAWGNTALSGRIEALGGVADALDRHGSSLAMLESVDSGNPLPSTRRDVGLGTRYLREWPAYARAHAERATMPHPDGLTYTRREPYGVVGRIIAFNHPSLFAVAGMVFPLLAGNAIVIKAADQTPIATLALGAMLADALPPGVVNIVAGGAIAGDALAVHPAVKRLAFVGSGRTARIIQSRLPASGLVKHFTAELGGKNAMIVCDDVDLDEAADAAIAGMSLRVSQGQSCQSTSRVLVDERVQDDLIARIKARLRRIRIGRAYDEAAEMGPLVSDEQRGRVESFLGDNLPTHCDVITGGGRPAVADSKGFYFEPTLVVGARPTDRIAREEIFGPVVTLHPWRSEEEALHLANGVALGLSAAVWSKDIDRALRLAHGVEAGYVWVNDANRHYPGAPFGGVKASGVGREECHDELLSYSETKAVNIRIASPVPDRGA